MSESQGRLPPKKDVALALLEQGPSVYVHVDPRRDGVVVPKHFTQQNQLVLQVGLNLAVRIHDLVVDDDGISCTLSFNRTPFWCCLPWPAIYALVGEDQRGMVWPESVPRDLVMQPRGGTRSAPAGEKKPRKRPGVRAVVSPPDDPTPVADAPVARTVPLRAAERPQPAVAAPSEAPAAAPGAGAGRGKKRELPPYLRVVK